MEHNETTLMLGSIFSERNAFGTMAAAMSVPGSPFSLFIRALNGNLTGMVVVVAGGGTCKRPSAGLFIVFHLFYSRPVAG